MSQANQNFDPQNLENHDLIQVETESIESVEKDEKGIGYIMNLVGLYLIFAICMVTVAWFGIFSEV
jgi:hypothetical protein